MNCLECHFVSSLCALAILACVGIIPPSIVSTQFTPLEQLNTGLESIYTRILPRSCSEFQCTKNKFRLVIEKLIAWTWIKDARWEKKKKKKKKKTVETVSFWARWNFNFQRSAPHFTAWYLIWCYQLVTAKRSACIPLSIMTAYT